MSIDRLAQTIKNAIDAKAAYMTRDLGIKYGYMRSDAAVEVDGKTYVVSPADNLSNKSFGYRGTVRVMITNGRAVVIG